jgi:creatinine amidohydrolase
MDYGKLTYTEIKDAALADWIVIIPTGCTEQQGIHLPVDFDTWFVGTLCNSASILAAEKHNVNSLVLPTMPFGPTPEHIGFGAGYINLPQGFHESVYEEVLKSLTDQGFRRIIIWQGCGQHHLSPMVERFMAGVSDSINIFFPEFPYQKVWDELVGPDVYGGHADGFATSISLYMRQDDVRKDKIRNPEYSMPNWSSPEIDLSKHSDTGSIGDLSVSSAKLGKKIWDSLIRDCAEIIYDYDQRTKESTP